MIALGRKRSNPVTPDVQEELLFRGLKRGKENGAALDGATVSCNSCNNRIPLEALGLTRFPVQWSWKCHPCTIKSRGEYVPYPFASSAGIEE